MKKLSVTFLCIICIIFSAIGLVACDKESSIENNDYDNPLTAEQIYEFVSPSVVTITAEYPQGQSSGTGFFYDNGSTIITNFHVIKNCSCAYITLSNGQNYDVLKVLGYNENEDIAILSVDYNRGKPLEIRNTDVKTGEKVYAIGNSYGELEGSFSEGIISSASREINGRSYIQTTVSVTNGNSGGPLIDKYGKIIGIVSAGLGDGSLELNFAIPISQVDSIDTTNPCLLSDIINVEWISNRQIWHQDKNDRYVLVFTLSDENENPVAVSGKATISIWTDDGGTVYQKVIDFSKEDFQIWYYDDYTVEKYQATIYIDDSDIEPSYCTSGKIYVHVEGEDYSFEAFNLDIQGLPQRKMTEIIEKDTLTVGVCADWIPYEYINDDGEFVGIEIDKISLVAKELNLQVKFINMPFEELFSAVLNNSVDCVIGMEYSVYRADSANCSIIFTEFEKTENTDYFYTVVYTNIRNDSLNDKINSAIKKFTLDGSFEKIENAYK